MRTYNSYTVLIEILPTHHVYMSINNIRVYFINWYCSQSHPTVYNDDPHTHEGYIYLGWHERYTQYRYGVKHGKHLTINYTMWSNHTIIKSFEYTIYDNGKKVIGIYFMPNRPNSVPIKDVVNNNPPNWSRKSPSHQRNPRNPRRQKIQRFLNILGNLSSTNSQN